MISWIQRTFQHHFRTMFAVLLGLIIVSFIIAFAPASGIGRAERSVMTRPFFGLNLASQMDQQRIAGDASLSINLQAGYMSLEGDQLQQYALQRYAALHLADELHIPEPTAAELADLVKTLHAFAGEDGQFDAKRYATFRDSLKTNARLTEADVTRVLSEDWRVSRVEQLLGGPGYVLPGDIKTQLVQADSTWTIAVATADYAGFAPGINPTAADLAKFFEENSFRYEIPPRMSASYVDFPAADFAGQVNVTDEEAKAYYTANPGRFPKPAADPKAVVPAKDEKPDPAADFAAVRPQVLAALKFERAQRLAVKAASDFAYALFDGKVTPGPALEAVLAAHKLVPKPLAPFTREAGPAELGGSPQIAEAAFKLGPDRFFSDALPSATGSVVLFWKETLPSRKPALAEVREKVSADYVDNEKRRLFVELGKSLRSQIEGRLKAGDTFEQAATAAGSSAKLEVKSPAPFTLQQPPQGVDYSVLGALERLDKGQVSEMIITQDKGSIVYVADKKAPDLAESSPAYLSAKAQLAGSIARYNSDAYLQEMVAQELKKSEPAVQ